MIQENLSRREFLKALFLVAGNIGLGGLLPPPREPYYLTVKDRVALMSDPDFFTVPKDGFTIITKQFDSNEYLGFESVVNRNNACGLATLTTVAKMSTYLNYEWIPDVRISNISQGLSGQKFTDIHGYQTSIMDWDNEIYFSALSTATKHVIPRFVSNARSLSSDYGARYSRILPLSDWPNVFSQAENVCENGGFVYICCLKYHGVHIALATNVKSDGSALIIDSYSGTAKFMSIKNYVGYAVDPEARFLGEQPALLDVIGVNLKIKDQIL